ncbi:hypothetical protein H6F91_25695, partial [Leptolyngbya sp. FACHB-8]|nr:hypothetical protein [Leptolyngbya sp. FACHB-8]MBD1909519.1 hypothetical protein [Leptolyngbya sp. FACHB-8]MBD1909973.1 hypothetical protein [Leptolyngbya sp. FACHB-8]MBD1910092.1 hypothetical protein [Leptolyngbya sp. FACHB-8]MBD1910281.1 hypothetical protein [Leptolyngbya sp. FACHB-8]
MSIAISGGAFQATKDWVTAPDPPNRCLGRLDRARCRRAARLPPHSNGV